MRVHYFQCNDLTYPECMSRNLFGDKDSRDLSAIQPDDFAVLYNFSTKTVTGLWQIVQTGRGIDPSAWNGRYPIQARVKLVTPKVITVRYSELSNILLRTPSNIPPYYDETAAVAILRAFNYRSIDSAPSAQLVPDSHRNMYRPPFFDEMIATPDWKVFEDFVHDILRLIGIHDLHIIPRNDQAGRSDGFFKFGTLAAIYDATLNSQQSSFKGQQIQNYIHQLKAGHISLPSSQRVTLQNCKKRVWIVTRSASQFVLREDDVDVCEIGISDLMELCEARIRLKMSASKLESELLLLGVNAQPNVGAL